jgi:cell division septation protein DedD
MKPFHNFWFSFIDIFRRKSWKRPRPEPEPDGEGGEKFSPEDKRPPNVAQEGAASIAVPAADTSIGFTSSKKKKRKKPTLPWIKVLMITFVVLLLAAGIFYKTYETQRIRKGSVQQQIIIREAAPALPNNSEITTSKDTLSETSNGAKKSASITTRDEKSTSILAEPLHAPEAAPSVKPQSGSELQVAVRRLGKDKLFSVQVKSVPTLDEARRTVEELKRKGEDAFSTHVTIKGRGEWNRILIGHFASTEDAAEFMKKNRIEAKYPGSIVQKIIEK